MAWLYFNMGASFMLALLLHRTRYIVGLPFSHAEKSWLPLLEEVAAGFQTKGLFLTLIRLLKE